MDANNLQNWVILDSGASSHFLLSTAPAVYKQIADVPRTVTLPNCDDVSSTHIAELNLLLLPQASRTAYIVPGLVSHSLVTVIKLCNDIYEVDVREILCEMRYRGRTIVKCIKCTRTGLWMMTLMNTIKQIKSTNNQDPIQNVTNNVRQTTSKFELAQYHHQLLFLPQL